MSYLPLLTSHLDHLLAATAALDGALWPSVLDTRTRRYPAGEHTPRRVYRLIGAPRGSTLYWDQPLVVAAYAVAERTRTPRYAAAADAYTAAFLARCVLPNGLFAWGNHQYYDVVERRVVSFSGGHHELRPITPAWDLFWRQDAARTGTYLRTMTQRHVYEAATGAFNRHDDGRRGHAFIEAGGILAESLAWLYAQTGERGLREQALRIARYSFGQRGATTGLVRNEPDHGRWDAKVATTETGVWAQCLLRAATYTGCEEFAAMARDAVRAYLERGYDAAAGTYFGQLAVDTGAPVAPSAVGYWPRAHTDPWNTDQWPTHDYPMALAEAGLTLHALTGDAVFREATERWARVASTTSPARTGGWTYAENYGRAIHFLARAGLQLHDDRLLAAASALADEAVARLAADGMCQGYPDSHLYESVDGVGYLFLALLLLETRRDPPLHGFGF